MRITRKHILSFIFLSVFSLIEIASFSLMAKPVLADDALFNDQTAISEIGEAYGGKKTDIRVIIGNLVQVVLGFLAAIFLALTIFAGFRYMTAAGNEEQTKKAIAQIRDSVIGLLIVLSSWILTMFILRKISRVVNNNVNL